MKKIMIILGDMAWANFPPHGYVLDESVDPKLFAKDNMAYFYRRAV